LATADIGDAAFARLRKPGYAANRYKIPFPHTPDPNGGIAGRRV
jgi:hypothetical protein